MTRKYELVYIVSPEASDEQVTDLHNQVEAMVQRIGVPIMRHVEKDIESLHE